MPFPTSTRISNALTRTREFNEKLINLVQKTPLLWDTKHPKYKDSFVSTLEWQSIAGQMNCSVSDIQLRWKNLRDTFTRRYKVLKESVKSGRATTPADINCLIRWKYFKKMLFLEDNVRHIKSKKLTLASATRQVKEDTIKQEVVSEPSAGEETQDQAESAAESSCPPEEIQLSLLLTSALEAQEEGSEDHHHETDSRSPLMLLPDMTPESSESSCGIQFPGGVPESPEPSASRQHQEGPGPPKKVTAKQASKRSSAMEPSAQYYMKPSLVDYDEAFALSLVPHLKNVPLELKGPCQLQVLETVIAFQEGRQPRNLLDVPTHFADAI